MVSAFHKTAEDFKAYGRATRDRVSLDSHSEYSPASNRSNPVKLIMKQNRDRLPWLVPIRHGRMSTSAFAFYRGGAKMMAEDLAHTPRTGINAQICGDAHLSNFGVFASPERDLVFDVNDFDETLAGPWEWDVKRLAASFMIAARHNEIDADESRQITCESVTAYREAMNEFVEMSYLDIWYSRIRFDDLSSAMLDAANSTKKDRKRVKKFERKARSRNRMRDLSKLTTQVDGQYRIKPDPPFIVAIDDLPDAGHPVEVIRIVRQGFDGYRESLPDNMRVLLDRYRPVDFALKVVGVGSVGTRCFILLMEGRDNQDPLFLQVKEATRSVLEDPLPPSPYINQGQRVVEGQQLMQATSDIFLGWTSSIRGRDFYFRQLKDMKGSMDVEAAPPHYLKAYAKACGWTLAHAHARSGDPSAIAGYLGMSNEFDLAVTAFAEKYADQNERDYKKFMKAINSEKIPYAPGYGD